MLSRFFVDLNIKPSIKAKNSVASVVPDTEKILLQRSATGDGLAFSELFNNYKFKLYGYVYRLTDSREMAEDIVQDVFLKLWDHRASLDQIDHLGSYIFRMAQNRTINAFKRTALETAIVRRLLTGQPEFSASTPESSLAVKEMEALFKKAIRQLPAQQRRVYQLSREEGLKYEEIARQLKISPGTVKNHMIQLLRTLREQMEKNLNSPASLYLFLLVIASFEK
jgi:RNA polymerase sigma-70 factor (ECF subfamily)